MTGVDILWAASIRRPPFTDMRASRFHLSRCTGRCRYTCPTDKTRRRLRQCPVCIDVLLWRHLRNGTHNVWCNALLFHTPRWQSCLQSTTMVSQTSNKSAAIAKKADRAAYDVRYSCRSEPPTWRCMATPAVNAEVTFTSHASAASISSHSIITFPLLLLNVLVPFLLLRPFALTGSIAKHCGI